MRVFLLACAAVAAIAFGAYAALELGLRRNAGEAFAVKGSTRVTGASMPDPRGFLAGKHQPAGGAASEPQPGTGEQTSEAAGAGAATPTR